MYDPSVSLLRFDFPDHQECCGAAAARLDSSLQAGKRADSPLSHFNDSAEQRHTRPQARYLRSVY